MATDLDPSTDSSPDSSPGPSTTGRPSPAAILLLGHGSHVDGRSSDSVHRLARMLRASGAYPEVRVAFWKEEPQLRHAFLLVESPRVVAVPFFTSEGYFTDRVLPRELRIDPPVSEVLRVARPGAGEGEENGKVGDPATAAEVVRVHYTRAVGAHPAMGDAVLERALDRLADDGLLEAGGTPPADVTLVVLGHGTERHPASGEIVEGITDRLARESSFRHVTCCFLDQDPRMLSVLRSLESPRAVLVPFFMAEGWHVGQTIPRDLNLEGGRSRVAETEILFTDPVGTHPAVVRVVEQMVAEAIGGVGGEARIGSSPGSQQRSGQDSVRWPENVSEEEGAELREGETDASPLPARARDAFLDWIDGGGAEGRAFLQTRVSPWDGSDPSGPRGSDGSVDRTLYEIRHVDDVGVAVEELERSRDPERARGLAGWTEEGGHRPLKTAPDLRRGWVLEGLDAGQVWEAYAHFYPVAPVHWHLGRRGRLPVIPFRETASRQTGIYEIVVELDDGDVRRVREEICEGGCLRRVRWPLEDPDGEDTDPEDADPDDPDPDGPHSDGPHSGGADMDGPDTDGPGPEDEVPCPEPCSLFITRAREEVRE